MQLLPNRENNRPLAIGLLVIALLAVYLVGFHWFFARHAALNEQISTLEQQAARFKAASARRPLLESRLDELSSDRLDSALFLPESNFNTAAAALTRRLRDTIEDQAEQAELCTVSATQNRPDPDPERFEQVTVNVRMNCPLDELVRVVYHLENSVPLIFVDELMIQQRMAADGRGRRGTTYGQLDVRFNMYGFLTERAGAR